MSLASWQGKGAPAPFFMTITIEVDGTPIKSDWQAQQTSNPWDPVDLYKLSDDLTDSVPTSSPRPDPEPDPDPEATRSKRK